MTFRRPFVGLCLSVLALHAAPPLNAADPHLIAHWLFDQNHVHGQTVGAAKAGPPATINGPATITTVAGPAALLLDGRQTSVLISKDIARLPLPRKEITAEAWVIVRKPQPWGGIVGILQDNGDYERGWLLGFVDANFCMAVSSVGRGRLTYLKATNAFEPGQWYHVAGTYDGRALKLYINGQLEASSQDQSGDIDYPPAAFAEIGAYHDDDEFYPMNGLIREVLLYDRALNEAEVQARCLATKPYFPNIAAAAEPFRPATGPFVEWASPNSVRVSWTTETPSPSLLEFGASAADTVRLEEGPLKLAHSLVVPGVAPETLYAYRIHGRDTNGLPATSPTYRLDTTYNYQLPPVPQRPAIYSTDAQTGPWEAAARRILTESGIGQGFALVLGAGEGRLACELARQSRLQLVVVEPDAAKVLAARQALDRAGLYGVRVSVHHGALTNLPYGDYFANLIVSEDMWAGAGLPGNPAEVQRCLRPNGGVLVLGQPETVAGAPFPQARLEVWLRDGGFENVQITRNDGLWATARRGPLTGAGEWTHQYGGADNSACSKDELIKGELSVLWWGEPGPRPMPDRGARNPAAVSSNGRLYVQGDRILFGIDAYNGTVLWSLAAPELRRANVPRDSSNMAATPDYLYIASGQYACGLNGQTGARELSFKVPETSAERPYEWGYLGLIDDILLGSGTRKGSAYLGDDGEWFDSASDDDVGIVTSDYLFGQERHTGARPWSYKGGVILNPTITVGDGVIYFIESRNPEARGGKSGRKHREVFVQQALVALDLRTGRKLWEESADFSAAKRMLYLSYGNHTLTLVGSSERDYHLWAYDAPARSQQPEANQSPVMLAGAKLWEFRHPFAREDHGGAIQHPLIVGDVLYSERRAFDLRSGKQLRDDLPERRGCGTMAAAQHSFFYRHHFHGMWDLDSNERVQFEGIRGGCWLGMIPSGGVVLAPETSSGCSCTHSVQTSVAYIPKGRPRK